MNNLSFEDDGLQFRLTRWIVQHDGVAVIYVPRNRFTCRVSASQCLHSTAMRSGSTTIDFYGVSIASIAAPLLVARILLGSETE